MPNSCGVYAGQLGYGPNPKLQQRIRDADLILAVGARLGEATTDGYTLITPDHPGQTLVHVHPDPNELGHVYHADLPICADMGEFAEMLDEWQDPDLVRFSLRASRRIAEWLEWSEPKPREGVALDLGPCVAAMREALPDNTIVCNGAGNFSGWWHRYWRYGLHADASSRRPAGTMGYGLPAAVAAAIRFKDRPVVCVAGDGDFLMNGQELATAAQYGADLLVIVVDNGSYGTIRMHQEREYPEAPLRHRAGQSRFRRARPRVRRLGRDGREDRGFRARARPRDGPEGHPPASTARPTSSRSPTRRRSRRSGSARRPSRPFATSFRTGDRSAPPCRRHNRPYCRLSRLDRPLFGFGRCDALDEHRQVHPESFPATSAGDASSTCSASLLFGTNG